jgi:anti-sigma B factor antagonist
MTQAVDEPAAAGWFAPKRLSRHAGPHAGDFFILICPGGGMPAVEYSVTTVNGLPVISAPAEVDVSNADGLRQLLLACADEGHTVLVVDMSETAFCDSTGLHQLVRAHKRATAAGGEVRLVITTPTVLRLFAIVGIDRFFPVFTSLAQAVASPSAPVARPVPSHGTASGAVAPERTGC